jgi:hypothetical protein
MYVNYGIILWVRALKKEKFSGNRQAAFGLSNDGGSARIEFRCGQREERRIQGGNMDPVLRALCLEVIGGDINSERFAWLLIETGVNVEGPEWDMANRLLEHREAINSLAHKFGETLQ